MTDKKWTIGEIINWTKQYFSEKGVESPRLDAEVLLSHVLRKDRLYLYVNFDQPLENDELTRFRELVKRRALREPVAYLLGRKEFMGLSFMVTPAVLIPRPDTEILVEYVSKKLAVKANPVFLDIGTGSGAIAVSLLTLLEEARGWAVDISAEALTIAEKNAVALEVNGRLDYRQGDLYAPVGDRQFDAVVSNPPYISTKEMGTLAPELAFEPQKALTDGGDGLAFYRRLVAQGASYLKNGGFLAMEVGAEQSAAVCALADSVSGLKVLEVIKDYAGIDRVVVLERRQV
ncbi:MAG: Protein-(glutamine-N5) methyltransferase, release factor-specific [Firmicutes bacterium]|nr:Protein-(glutamine-N5) methyltransferase, release factor-specific [Bacillota bacterium]